MYIYKHKKKHLMHIVFIEHSEKKIIYLTEISAYLV